MEMARPSSYREEYAEQARKLCLLGATDKEMADFFGVSEQTLNAWKNAHPEFLEALKKGKAQADADVADRLYQRAMGYSHPAVKIMVVGGEVKQEPYTEHYPPDTTAAIFWLKNRARTKWRDKVDQEISGPDGKPIEQNLKVEFVNP
ncbi:helix-turn-helix domain-containing protein [Cupriavidus gilardii]|uniref:Helix-turn-helix domain-containing protein n=1 Tax=Cupriavidus gilardii TaxID=82541 RepID=A0ABY4VQG1_9BURK|nr:helix-turn-helix domain-containing protein [Cupriavidus gilardii]USE79494.1 helix-turn-helix domain-containing protein [Cupriavidus gilardii]